MSRDTTETDVGEARYRRENSVAAEESELTSCVTVVSGPDDDGDICVMLGTINWLPPETAKALAIEILRRLQIKPMELEY